MGLDFLDIFEQDDHTPKSLRPSIKVRGSKNGFKICFDTSGLPSVGLHFGNCLKVLTDHHDDSIDLVYLDPPFNSKRDYNLVHHSSDPESDAQSKAFSDTWQWGEEASKSFAKIQNGNNIPLAHAMASFRHLLQEGPTLAYLSMMAPILVEIRRVMKPTASVYLHCDPSASHYLKILMDSVFGGVNFRNEIAWCYGKWTNSATYFQRNHDIILFYSKMPVGYTFNKIFGDTPSAHKTKGYHTNVIKGVTQLIVYDAIKAADKIQEGKYDKIVNSEDSSGAALSDWWEIPILNPASKERLGYPTQKPLALLERIVLASSNPDDVVLDPFCGSGTTLVAAHKHGRKAIGIDIHHRAIYVIRKRMADLFGSDFANAIHVHGDPTDIAGVRELTPYDFEDWVRDNLGANSYVDRKGNDKGIDAVLYMDVDAKQRTIPISIKSGEHLVPDMVQSLAGVMEGLRIRDYGGDIGVLVTAYPPTNGMIRMASGYGYYQPKGIGSLEDNPIPRVQILTAMDILAGKRPITPAFGFDRTFKATRD